MQSQYEGSDKSQRKKKGATARKERKKSSGTDVKMRCQSVDEAKRCHRANPEKTNDCADEE